MLFRHVRTGFCNFPQSRTVIFFSTCKGLDSRLSPTLFSTNDDASSSEGTCVIASLAIRSAHDAFIGDCNTTTKSVDSFGPKCVMKDFWIVLLVGFSIDQQRNFAWEFIAYSLEFVADIGRSSGLYGVNSSRTVSLKLTQLSSISSTNICSLAVLFIMVIRLPSVWPEINRPKVTTFWSTCTISLMLSCFLSQVFLDFSRFLGYCNAESRRLS